MMDNTVVYVSRVWIEMDVFFLSKSLSVWSCFTSDDTIYIAH
jgi:hypothetical protein